MLIACDVGNTAATFGVFKGERLLKQASEPAGRGDFPAAWKREFSDLDKSDITGAVLCSVNPPGDKGLRKWLRSEFGVKPLVVGENAEVDIPISYSRPEELGSDRLVNAYWARRRVDRGAVIVDFGTAVTFDVVSRTRGYLGGLIAPGINLSRRALAEWTALLPLVDVKPGGPLVGKSTEQAINAGLFHGFTAMVDGILLKLINNLKSRPRILSTGGDGRHVTAKSVFIEEWIPDLTLQGLRLIYENHEAKNG